MAWWSRGSTDQDRSIFLGVTDPGSGAASTGGASSYLYISRERKTWSILLATPSRRSPCNRGYSTQMVLPLPHRSTGLRAAKVQSRLEADLDRQLSVY